MGGAGGGAGAGTMGGAGGGGLGGGLGGGALPEEMRKVLSGVAPGRPIQLPAGSGQSEEELQVRCGEMQRDTARYTWGSGLPGGGGGGCFSSARTECASAHAG